MNHVHINHIYHCCVCSNKVCMRLVALRLPQNETGRPCGGALAAQSSKCFVKARRAVAGSEGG